MVDIGLKFYSVPSLPRGLTFRSRSQTELSYISQNYYAPNFEKVGRHIASGLSLRLFVRSSHFLVHSITLEPCMLMYLNFMYGFPIKK